MGPGHGLGMRDEIIWTRNGTFPRSVGICSAKWTKTAAEQFHVRSLHRRRDAVECLDAAECHIKPQPQGPANGHGTLHECCQSICHDAGTSEQILRYLGTRIACS